MHGIERKLLNYFMLIVVATLMIGVEFVAEMSRPELRTDLWERVSTAVAASETAAENVAIFEPLLRFRNKIVTMLGVLMAVVAIVLLMFIRNVTTPLQRMVEVADRINAGDLNPVIATDRTDEIGSLARAINGLTSNIQELVAMTQHTSEQIGVAVAEARACIAENAMGSGIKNRGDVETRLARIDTEAGALRDLVADFELLQHSQEKG